MLPVRGNSAPRLPSAPLLACSAIVEEELPIVNPFGRLSWPTWSLLGDTPLADSDAPPAASIAVRFITFSALDQCVIDR